MLRSVRLRLLCLAFLPLSVLIPALLMLAMTRWTADYDRLLIANVASDLRIAEQYLGKLQERSARDLAAIAGSAALAQARAQGETTRADYLETRRAELGYDFLIYLSGDALVEARARWPVIDEAARTARASAIDVFSQEDMQALSPDLAARARVYLRPDPVSGEGAALSSRQSTAADETHGMIIHSAAALPLEEARQGAQGAMLVAGVLLNRNLDFIDQLNALVYRNDDTGLSRQGTATLFLGDRRISTNVRLFEDVRAIGTQVSDEVRVAVLERGQTWLDRAFVVNDWYISGYLPLLDSFGARVGMLYVGFLEAPYSAAKRLAYWNVLGAVALVIALATPLFLWLAKGIFAPLEKITRTMARVEGGDLSARNGSPRRQDEIAQVARHLDALLDQVQERDRKLRQWAQELNTRVEQRTGELREANIRLEAAYRQLVMSEKLASIGEITAGVAHEINNPVAVIQGNVDVMRMTLGAEGHQVQTELDLIDNQVMRIGSIVSKLLQFARPSEFGTFSENVDIACVVRDCLLLVDHAVSKQAVRVITELMPAPPAPPVPMVRIDPGELQQVVVNVVLNACQAMAGQSTPAELFISVAQETRDGHAGAALIIRDSGPGLDPRQAAQIFDPFFTTKRGGSGAGTGLGLSISQTLIQRAGGLISARNHPGGGAEFVIWLPDAREGDPLPLG